MEEFSLIPRPKIMIKKFKPFQLSNKSEKPWQGLKDNHSFKYKDGIIGLGLSCHSGIPRQHSHVCLSSLRL